MNSRLLTALLCLAGTSLTQAAEVYFDTVSTAKTSRLHGAYISAHTGVSDTGSIDTSDRLSRMGVKGDTGWTAGLKFGYMFTTPTVLRPALELELSYLTSELSGSKGSRNTYRSDFQAFNAFGNAVMAFDFEDQNTPSDDFLAKIKPYIGAGVGVSLTRNERVEARIDGRRIKDEDGGKTSFGYQVFAGLEVPLSDELSLFGEYKYVNLYDLGGGDIQGADFNLYTVGLRLQY